MKNVKIGDFIEDLYSDKPAPGGGGAAALAGALSAALCGMVYNLSVHKKFFEEYDENIKNQFFNGLEKLDKLKDKMIDYIAKDAEAFNGLMDTFKLPKDTEEEKQARTSAIQQAYKNSLSSPLAMAEEVLEVYELLILGANFGNPNLVSDISVGALMLNSTIRSGIVNVNVNLTGIKDLDYKASIETKCNEILKVNEENTKKVEEICMKKLGFKY